MYELINKHADQIVDAAGAEFISKYEWLCQNPTDPKYEIEYRNFWAMGGAHLSIDFYPVYFDLLKSACEQANENPIEQLTEVTRKLYEASKDSRGRKSIQFSFATKLIHTANSHLPIYDSMIAEFFFFQGPAKEDVEGRIGEYVSFYKFLIEEYKRVLDNGLLAKAIELFRHNCTVHHWTDEKIIDSLIWAFVPLLRNRQIPYA